MKMRKVKIMSAVLFSGFCLGACGMSGDAKGKGAGTPEEAMQCTMESLKELDLDAFNSYTDNYVETYYNWLGIPVEAEYRVFNELLQPGLKKGKRYRFHLQMAEKTVEGLEWEITDVREGWSPFRENQRYGNHPHLRPSRKCAGPETENPLGDPNY